MNGFQKRVALLEKWAPSLLPNVKDIDDLADIIYDTWLEAEADTEQRIIKLLEEAMCSSKYDNPDNGDCMGYCYHCQWRTEIIELIKGETK